MRSVPPVTLELAQEEQQGLLKDFPLHENRNCSYYSGGGKTCECQS